MLFLEVEMKELGRSTWNDTHSITSFFFLSGFFLQTLTIHRTAGKGGDHPLFHSTTSTRSRTFRHLFATLHVR